MWKLYDDYKRVSVFTSWKDILEQILGSGALPTVLLYERVTEATYSCDMYDKMFPDDLYYLYKQAYNIQKMIDMYETSEAQNAVKNKKEKEKAEKEKQEANASQKGGVVPDPKQSNA